MSPELAAPGQPSPESLPSISRAGLLGEDCQKDPPKPWSCPWAGGAEGYRGQHLSRTGLLLRRCPSEGMLLLQGRKHIMGLAVPSRLRPQLPSPVPVLGNPDAGVGLGAISRQACPLEGPGSPPT